MDGAHAVKVQILNETNCWWERNLKFVILSRGLGPRFSVNAEIAKISGNYGRFPHVWTLFSFFLNWIWRDRHLVHPERQEANWRGHARPSPDEGTKAI